MQIASLIRHHSHDYRHDPTGITYAAAHPIDGELLTGWFETIMKVDDALQDIDDTIAWGLNIAAYAGESDVPPRLSEE